MKDFISKIIEQLMVFSITSYIGMLMTLKVILYLNNILRR